MGKKWEEWFWLFTRGRRCWFFLDWWILFFPFLFLHIFLKIKKISLKRSKNVQWGYQNLLESLQGFKTWTRTWTQPKSSQVRVDSASQVGYFFLVGLKVLFSQLLIGLRWLHSPFFSFIHCSCMESGERVRGKALTYGALFEPVRLQFWWGKVCTTWSFLHLRKQRWHQWWGKHHFPTFNKWIIS